MANKDFHISVQTDNLDIKFDKIKSQFKTMSVEDIAIKIICHCRWYNTKIAFWLIKKAPIEALTFEDNIAFINAVEDNHLDIVKAFVKRGAIPTGEKLKEAVGEVCTAHHQNMSLYFIDKLRIDVNLDPVILQPYLLAKGLTPTEYLSICPESHRGPCLSIMGKPIEKSRQEIEYDDPIIP